MDSLSHITEAEREMHFDTCRYDHHGRDSLLATYCRTRSGSQPAGAYTRRPSASSTLTQPAGIGSRFSSTSGIFLGRPRPARSMTVAVTRVALSALFTARPNSVRHRKIMGGVTPWRRATMDTVTPRSAASARIASFCLSVYWRRAGCAVGGAAARSDVPSAGLMHRSYLNSSLIFARYEPRGRLLGCSNW